MAVKLYVDLDTLKLIEGPGFRNPVGQLDFKRGDAAPLEVRFLAGGTTPTTIGDPATLELRFGAKPTGQYGAPYVVFCGVWTMAALDAPDPVYTSSPSFNTTELDVSLGIGGSELTEVELMAEITWREGTGQPTSTGTVKAIVANDVNRGTEGEPAPSVSSEEWLAARAVLTSAQDLDEIARYTARDNIGARGWLVADVPMVGMIYRLRLSGYNRTLVPRVSGGWSDGIASIPF